MNETYKPKNLRHHSNPDMGYRYHDNGVVMNEKIEVNSLDEMRKLIIELNKETLAFEVKVKRSHKLITFALCFAIGCLVVYSMITVFM